MDEVRGENTTGRFVEADYQWTSFRRHMALGFLCFVAFFNLLDRQIITILLEPIKKEFSASDTEMGLLTGSFFALFYAAASIPLGRLADRYSRSVLISACLAVWSVMSALGGMAGSFVQLALTRCGLAIGEAGSIPASYAAIADLYPIRHRAKAVSLYAAASSMGAGSAVILGGWLVGNVGWRMTLVVVGVPGVVLAMLLLLFMKDPPRGLSDPSHGLVPDAPVPMSHVLDYLRGLRSYRWVLLAPAFAQMAFFGILGWGPTFMLRVYEMPPGRVSLLFGGVSTIALVLGQLAGGALSDWAGKRDIRGYMWVSAIMTGLGCPFGLLFLFAESHLLAMTSFGLLIFCMAPGTMFAAVMVQSLAPPRMRGMSSTILLLVVMIFGVGFAPLFVGASNDILQSRLGWEAIRYSLAIVVGFLALSSASALTATRWLRSDYERLHGTSAGKS